MKFLSKMLQTGKSDPLGLDSTLDGIRQLKKRLETERQGVEKERDRLRDAALNDPESELGTDTLLAREKRVEALEAVLEKALIEGSRAISSRMPEIKKAIERLEAEKRDLSRKRDLEYTKAVRLFVEKTGGQVVEPPRKGHGGMISIPGTSVMDLAEIDAALKGLPAPGHPEPTPTIQALDDIAAQLHKLSMLTHYGSLRGLETLAGTCS